MFNPTLAGQHNSTAPTLTDGQYAPVELDVNGNQKVVVQGTVPVSVSNLPATQAVSGTVAVGNFPATQPVSLATAPTTTVVQPTGTNLHVVVDSAPTTAVTGTFFPATQPVSIAATVPSKLTPQTSGGCSTHSASIGALATAIKASPGQLYGCVIGNSNTTAVYVQLFDATSVTLGTTAPKLSFFIPAGGGLTRDFANGVQFATGIMYACTTTRTGATSPTNTVDVNFDYL
jgi:hypothetical protein